MNMEADDAEGTSTSLNNCRQMFRRCSPINLTAHRIGLLYSVISAISLGISAFLLALSGESVEPLQILFETFGLAAFCAVMSMIFLCIPMKPYKGETLYVLLHALAMSVAQICNTYGVILIAPSLATVIVDTNLIFATLFAFVFLHESIDMYDGISILITCIGAVIVSVPTILLAPSSSLKSSVLGVSLEFLCAISVASYGCFNRKIEKTHPSVITVVAFASVSFVAGVTCIGTGRFTLHHETRYVLIIIANGVFLALGHILLSRAYQLTVISYVNTTNTMDAPTVMLLQTIFLNVHLTIFPILGSIAIMIGVILLGLKEWIMGKVRGMFHRTQL